MNLELERKISVGDLLTVFSILITLVVGLISFERDQHLHRKEEGGWPTLKRMHGNLPETELGIGSVGNSGVAYPLRFWFLQRAGGPRLDG